jgi:hypothetical protein
LKKRTKKLFGLDRARSGRGERRSLLFIASRDSHTKIARAQTDKSLFASFSSEKEESFLSSFDK